MSSIADHPWAEGGKFTRLVAPADRHPLAGWTRGGPAQWPQVFTTRGTRSPASTAFFASSPAANITDGFDVLVQEVMAAMRTSP